MYNRSVLGGAGNTTRGLTRGNRLDRLEGSVQPTQLPSYRKPRRPIVIPGRVAKRATERFVLDQDTGCHVSTYSVASHGYAQVGWQNNGDRQMVTAHRAAWAFVHGQIPEGMTIDHLCKNRRCVNVEHLRMMTNYENARRTSGRDWPLGQCVNGHSNDLLRKNWCGQWKCSVCAAQYQRDYRARKREKVQQQ